MQDGPNHIEDDHQHAAQQDGQIIDTLRQTEGGGLHGPAGQHLLIGNGGHNDKEHDADDVVEQFESVIHRGRELADKEIDASIAVVDGSHCRAQIGDENHRHAGHFLHPSK